MPLVSDPTASPSFDLNNTGETWWIDVRRYTTVRLYAEPAVAWTTAVLTVYHAPERGGVTTATGNTLTAASRTTSLDTTSYDWLAARVTTPEGGAALAFLKAVRKYDPESE